MKHFISFFLLYLLLFSACGQQQSPIAIQYITLKDTVLVKEIEKVIQEEVSRKEDTSTTIKAFTENFFKKGLGYVVLYIEGNLQGDTFHDGDTICRYYAAASLISIKKEAADNVYPPFYTYIGGRLVLVHMPILENVANLKFSSRSKKKLRKRIDAFLEKPRDVTAYNMDGSVAFRDKHFQIDYFRFHGGRYIYILKNKPPIVVPE